MAYKNRDARLAYCKQYYKDNSDKAKRRAVKWRKKQKRILLAIKMEYLKTHPCVGCGEKDPIVIDFDHLRDKKFCISNLIHRTCSVETLKKEMAKCVVRCANCHRRITAKRRKRKK